ncbi:MAG: carbon-nitrogen hydrolase family protein [Nitrososphaerales archaeon]
MSRVAVVQLRASEHKDENLKISIGYIKEAKSKNADLVAFPEFLMTYSPPRQSAEELSKVAESIDGDFVSALKHAAKTHNISVVATIYEKSQLQNRVYDTALLIDSKGNLSATYRKLHLYDALGFKESDKLVAGNDLIKPVKTNLGILGMMICYDIRFPEMSRILTLMGADTLVLPSAWVQGDMKVEHWQTMLKARAIENGCYVVAPDQVSNIYIGHSMVVDPFGKIILDMEEREGLEVVDLDSELVKNVRDKLPLLDNRRDDIYSKYS